ncbi:MAG: alpha-amylase [Tannerellaceae bacterium]|nr:alpha-amylase [Tannerellaceae bacterium]
MKHSTYYLVLVISLLLAACGGGTKSSGNETDPYLTEVKHPDWSRNAVMYEVNIRQYTQEGTITAFRQHLPRLKELGVDILWLMPVCPISEVNRKGTMGSYYASQNYTAVNPEFGTLEDFKGLVNEAHNMGFKVILDWVANHSGCDNVWLEQHPDWYVRDEQGNPISPYDWTDTYKLNYDNPELRQGMIDALTFWVTECDIDGYRCDVAYEVPTDFWEDARKQLDAIKPVFMLAEADAPELTVKAFDMTYNWPFKNLMNQIAQGDSAKKSTYAPIDAPEKMSAKQAIDIDEMLASYNECYPRDTYVMNFITNHDENSWDGSEFKRFGKRSKGFCRINLYASGNAVDLYWSGNRYGT